MKVSPYEKTYVSTFKALTDTMYVDKVAEFIKNVGCAVTCKEVGQYIFGADYATRRDDLAKSHSAILGQILAHLVRGKFVNVEKIYDEPIEIEVEDYVRCDANGQPSIIKVHDDEGNEYEIPNPKYKPTYRSSGKWVTVKKTIHPSHKVYTWAVD